MTLAIAVLDQFQVGAAPHLTLWLRSSLVAGVLCQARQQLHQLFFLSAAGPGSGLY